MFTAAVVIYGIILAVMLSILSIIFLGIWVYKDATQRGLNGWLWALVTVFVGNLIGFILYLLVGRKEGVVEGEVKPYKGLIITTIVLFVLSIVIAISTIVFSTFSGDGFMFERSYGGYSYNSGGFAKKITDKSGGSTWEISFDETSPSYSLDKIYNSNTKVNSVSVDLTTQGSAMLIISQNDVYINETIENGSYTFDLSDFDTGKIYFKLINVDAKSMDAKFVVS